MSFHLNIRFAGMCLLVPDPGSPDFHVVLPPTGRNHASGEGPHDHHGAADEGHSVELHLAQLLYDPGHEDGSGPQDGREPKRVELDDTWLRFPDLPASAPDPELRKKLRGRHVADLTEIFDLRVRRPLLGPARPSDRVLSRITMPVGAPVRHDPGALWRIGKRGRSPQQMSIWIELSIRNVPGDTLRIARYSLEGDSEAEPLLLRPGPGNRTINLYIYHAPKDEIPRRLPPPVREEDEAAELAHHFLAFYQLFDPFDAPEEERIPEYVGPGVPASGERGQAEQSSAEAGVSPKKILGSRVTCVLAMAEVEPEH